MCLLRFHNVRSEVADTERHLGPPSWGLGVEVPPQSHKRNKSVEETVKLNSQRDGCIGSQLVQRCRKKRKDIQIATWNGCTVLQPEKMNETELMRLKRI
jgi:hypothetical protein